MLEKLRKNGFRIFLLLLLASLLVGIRAFEDVLFYDPFAAYFKNDYLNLPFPEYDGWQLFLAMGFRYFLNTVISLAILYILFNKIQLVHFAGVLYLIFFVFLLAGFFGILAFADRENNFALFYTRRFLIQPLLLLLFVPAFYYQERIPKK